MDTDIRCAVEAVIDSVLVLSGISTLSDLEKTNKYEKKKNWKEKTGKEGEKNKK